MHVPLSICSSDSSRCIPEYDLPCTKDGDRRSRNNFTRAVARKFTRSRHSYGRRGSEWACAGGRRGAQGAANASGRAGDGRAVGPASARGNNDVQHSGPLSVWVAEDGAGQGGAGRAGTRRGGGMGGGPGPGLDGWDRAGMGLLG